MKTTLEEIKEQVLKEMSGGSIKTWEYMLKNMIPEYIIECEDKVSERYATAAVNAKLQEAAEKIKSKKEEIRETEWGNNKSYKVGYNWGIKDSEKIIRELIDNENEDRR